MTTLQWRKFVPADVRDDDRCTCFKTTTYILLCVVCLLPKLRHFNVVNLLYNEKRRILSVVREHPSRMHRQHQLSLGRFRLCINYKLPKTQRSIVRDFVARDCRSRLVHLPH